MYLKIFCIFWGKKICVCILSLLSDLDYRLLFWLGSQESFIYSFSKSLFTEHLLYNQTLCWGRHQDEKIWSILLSSESCTRVQHVQWKSTQWDKFYSYVEDQRERVGNQVIMPGIETKAREASQTRWYCLNLKEEDVTRIAASLASHSWRKNTEMLQVCCREKVCTKADSARHCDKCFSTFSINPHKAYEIRKVTFREGN